MKIHTMIALSAVGTMALGATAHAQESGADVEATAIVAVRTVPPGVQGSFVFSGVPEGTATAGTSLSAAGLASGEYASVLSNAPAGLVLMGILCDDLTGPTPSEGDVESGRATFRVEPGETVTCVFLYRSPGLAGGAAGTAASGGPVGAGTPGGPAGAGSPGGSGPPATGTEGEACEAPVMVPKAGRWNVANHLGQMRCGSLLNLPLDPRRGSGVLEIRDCGWTVVGTGLGDDEAPMTMHAIDRDSGIYYGTVGGEHDGIPMTIHFLWNLTTSESIVGELSSTVSESGVTCQMSRSFDMDYAGP